MRGDNVRFLKSHYEHYLSGVRQQMLGLAKWPSVVDEQCVRNYISDHEPSLKKAFAQGASEIIESYVTLEGIVVIPETTDESLRPHYTIFNHGLGRFLNTEEMVDLIVEIKLRENGITKGKVVDD